MPTPDNISKLYDELHSTYDVGTEQDFRNYLSDPNNREALRKELADDYDVGDSVSFSSYLGYREDKPQPTSQQPKQEQKSGSSWMSALSNLAQKSFDKASEVKNDLTNRVQSTITSTSNEQPAKDTINTTSAGGGWRDKPIMVNYAGNGTPKQTTEGAVVDELYSIYADAYNHGKTGDRTPYDKAEEAALKMGIQEADDDLNMTNTYSLLHTAEKHADEQVARQAAMEFVHGLPEKMYDSNNDVSERFYNRDFQESLYRKAARLGMNYEDFVDKYFKPALTGYMKERFGGDYKDAINPLFNKWEDVFSRMENNDAINITGNYLGDSIDKEFAEFDQKADSAFAENYHHNPYSSAASAGQYLVARRSANEANDPDKVLQSLKNKEEALFRKIVDNPQFKADITKRAEAIGLSPAEYVEQYVVPNFTNSIVSKFEQTAVAREMPKDSLDYIMRGITDDSVIGMLLSRFVYSESRQRYRNQASALTEQGKNPDVDPNLVMQTVRLGANMGADAWLWAGSGKAASSVVNRLVGARIATVAAERNITIAAARRIVEEEASRHLGKRIAGNLLSHVPQSSITMGLAEGGGEAARAIRDRENFGDAIGSITGKVARGSAIGIAFGGTSSIAGGMTARLTGAKALLGKLAAYEVEAGTMYTTEELSKMMNGEDAFQNPFTGIAEANVKLAGIKLSASPAQTAARLLNAVAHPVKTVRSAMKGKFGSLTDADVADLQSSTGGKTLMDALVALSGGKLVKGEGERQGYATREEMAEAAARYHDYMTDPERPADRKQRVARVLGTMVPPPGKEVSADITQAEDGTFIVKTRDIDGQCVSETRYDSEADAQEEVDAMWMEFKDNLIGALRRKIDLTDTYGNLRAELQSVYEDASAKQKAGVELTEREKQAVQLRQHVGELIDIQNKLNDGKELTEEERSVGELLNAFFETGVLSQSHSDRFTKEFESDNELPRGSVEQSIEGHMREEALELVDGVLEDIVYIGDGRWRTNAESNIIDAYIMRLREEVGRRESTAETETETNNTAQEVLSIEDKTRYDIETNENQGYEISDTDEKQDAKARVDVLREQVGGFLDENAMLMLDEEPIATLKNMRESEQFTDDQVQQAADYVNAKARYNGMVRRVQDDIDAAIAESDRSIDERVAKPDNGGDGMIHPATLKVGDKPVYIVSGNVKMTADGTMVDVEGSDKDIIVLDTQTGEVNFVDAKDIKSVDAAIDPEEERQLAAGRIREEMAKKAADEIDGTQPFNLNDEFDMLVDGKVVHAIVTQEDNGDGVEVQTTTEDGQTQVQVVPRDQLQQAVDDLRKQPFRDEIKAPVEEPKAPAAQPQAAETEGAIEGEQQEAAESAQQTALSRIPVDERGGRLYEQASHEDSYDALVEQLGEEGAIEIAKSNVSDATQALKKLEKKKPTGKTTDEKVASLRAIAQERARHQATIDYWNAVQAVPNNRRAEAERISEEEEKARREATAKREEEAKRQAREAQEKLNGVPDVLNDKAEDARARGYRNVNGNVVMRQEGTGDVYGREVDIKFSKSDTAKGHMKVIEADDLQPSHVNGQRNPKFFIDEAQPKDRTDAVSSMAAAKIASALNPEEITGGGSAYQFSAPTVNTRGEVVQGNNRSDALKLMYDNNAFAPSVEAYKAYLMEHADEFGLDRDAIASMKKPVLVNEIDVTDEDAIRLGQMKASDIESSGIERIDAKSTTMKLGKRLSNFANVLLSSANEEASLSELLVENGVKALKWLNTNGIISDTQLQSAVDRKGNITAEGKMDLQNILKQSLFAGGVSDLPKMFDAMPDKAQKAILSTFMRDMDSDEQERILPFIQESIEAYHEVSASTKEFNEAGNYETAHRAMDNWTRQYHVGINGESLLPSEKFSNFAIELATRYRGTSMSNIAKNFNDFYDMVQGKGELDMFSSGEPGEKTSVADAIRKVYDVELKPKTNETIRSNAVGGNAETSPAGRRGEQGDGTSGEPDSQGTGTAVAGGRVEGSDVEQPAEEPAQPVSVNDKLQEARSKYPDRVFAGRHIDGSVTFRGEDATLVAQLLDRDVDASGEITLDKEEADKTLPMLIASGHKVGYYEDNETPSAATGQLQGLEGYSEDDILSSVRNDIEDKLSAAGVDGVTIKGMAIHGSRKRGDARTDSDLDVVVEYDGDISEDGLFNLLNEEPLEINGIRVDINPITKGKSGTLEQYMERSRKYDAEKGAEQEVKAKANLDPRTMSDEEKGRSGDSGLGTKRQGDLEASERITDEERTAMQSRIIDWLSDENLSSAIGKSRSEIFDLFGNELEPIAYIPSRYLSLVSKDIVDPRIYCGKGYFIDHALRNHGQEGTQASIDDVDVNKYLNIQTVLDNPDAIKETFVDGKRTVVFVKKIGRYFAELTQVEEEGKIILHKSLFGQKKEPYGKLADIRSENSSSEGGASSISHAERTAPAISLQSRGDDMSEKSADDSPTISAGKDTDLFGNVQEKTEKSSPAGKIDDVGEKILGARKDMLHSIAKAFDDATLQSLIELPFSKAFKKPNLKKAVESGALREEDALFYEAMFAALVNPSKPSAQKRGGRRKIEEWAQSNYEALKLIRRIFDTEDVAERDRIMSGVLAIRYPNEKQERERQEKLKEWNKHLSADHWGEKWGPNPVWVAHEILKGLGYKAGDKVNIPFSRVVPDTSNNYYIVCDAKANREKSWSQFDTPEEAIEYAIYLSKLKDGEADLQHPVRMFSIRGTKPIYSETGKYEVYDSGRLVKTFDDEASAKAYAEKGKWRTALPQRVRSGATDYRVYFTHPITGEHIFVGDTFETKAEAKAYLDGNYETVNDAVNTELAKAAGTNKRDITADDLLEVTMGYYKENGEIKLTYIVQFCKEYFNPIDSPLHEEFETRDEAKAFLNKVKDGVFEEWKKYKEKEKSFVYFSDGENTRKGEDYRGGRDVGAEDFMNTFGFRGVQFGNWTNQSDRQMAVNQAYDAFMDLAKLLGVSPKALSLNGELGIAFGARGSGNANAHYEPGEIVINLTKTRGAGSLAHEWWHAMDNYFARAAGVPGGMVTDSKSIEMREELREAYNNLIDKLTKSKYYTRSKAKGDYWGRMHEVTARLLAEWVDQELQKNGELNTFLSRGADVEKRIRLNYALYEMMHKHASSQLSKEEREQPLMSYEEFRNSDKALAGIPYPSKEEVAEFGESLRNIFDTVQERVDEETGNVELFRDEDDAPIFFSNAEKAVEGIKQNKATAEQWLAMIQKNGGLKAGEDKWLGLSDWLNERKGQSVTKEELLNFIRENQVQIEEVHYEETSLANLQAEFDEIYDRILDGVDSDEVVSYPAEQAWEELRERYNGGDDFDLAFYLDEHLNIQVGNEDAAGYFLGVNPIDSTRLDYTTPGLENKREIALVVPTVEPYNENDTLHFGDAGEGRAVAWVRFGETTDADENRVLVVDEIQSKRHQDARENGYKPEVSTQQKQAYEEARIEARKAADELRAYHDSLSSKYGKPIDYVHVEDLFDTGDKGTERWMDNFTEEERAEYDRLQKRRKEATDIVLKIEEEMSISATDTKVPAAPFEKNWHELVMKRVLRYAAENGYDKVAWTTGEQQAERYNLGSVVKKIEASPYKAQSPTESDGHDLMLTLNDGTMHEMFVQPDGTINSDSDMFDGKKVGEVFGKEIGEKITSAQEQTEISGDGLRVGGEGMKGFYDQILPRFMDKYGKKWGAKTQDITLPDIGNGGVTMHSVDVTPEMKESVIKGQPMFREGTEEQAQQEPKQRTAKEQRSREAFAERQWRRAKERAREWVEKLNISDRTEVYDSIDDVPGSENFSDRKRRSRGWYNKDTGKIVIVLGNHRNPSDVVRTILHEAVAHYGLRKLFGKNLDNFLDNVYNGAEIRIKEAIMAKAVKLKNKSPNSKRTTEEWRRVATEEYLAELAESTDFENTDHPMTPSARHWFNKIKGWFFDMLSSLGLKDFGGRSLHDVITDNELRYILWRSYENLTEPGRYRNVFSEAKDIAMQHRLKVGEFERTAEPRRTERAASPDERVEQAATPDERVEQARVVADANSGNEAIDAAYKQFKEKHSDAILLVHMADGSYRAVGEDKQPVSTVFGESAFGNNGEQQFYAVPERQLDLLLPNLIRRGNKVAIMEEPTGDMAHEGAEDSWRFVGDGVEEANSRFNEQLSTLTEENADRVALSLGSPSDILQAAGVENKPMKLYGNKVVAKMKKHGFGLNELRDLPRAVAAPIAVFDNIGRPGNRSILTELRTAQGNFLVTIDLGKDADVDFNIVSSVFGKGDTNIVDWFNRGLATYVNKEKALAFLFHQSAPIAATAAKAELNSAAKIIENFENPKISEEKFGDDSDLFRDDDFSPRDRAIARDTYERMVSTGGYQFQEAVQDSMLGLKRLYQSILGKGTRMEDVDGFENAYLAENRMSSVNAAEQREYYVRYMKPLLKAISDIAGANNGKRQELTDYMMAKHGLERNMVMAQRDFDAYQQQYPSGTKTLDDFRERDYAGLTALTGEDDVAMAELAAQQMVDNYEQDNDTTELWQRVNDATSATLAKIYSSGLLSKERYEQIQKMFEHYIPLQGWDETTSDEVYGYLTSKNGPLGGSPIKHAKGRSSKADDPIATIALMADDAIRQGNRNKMKQTFLNFVLNHQSDLVSVNDLWLQYNAALDEWEPVFADIEDGDTAADVERKVEVFEERMRQLAESDPDNYKHGRDAQNIPYKVVKGNLKEHQVLVRRNGRTYVLTINGNPRAAQALNGLTNPDVETGGVIGNLMQGAQWLNRNLSAFYTTRNPEFVAANFLRDMLYSNCMTWVKESPKYALRFHKNFGRVNPAHMRILLGKWENGTLDESNYIENLFKQFMLNGGETGYTNIKDIDGHKREIASELKRNGSNARKAWQWLGKQLDLLNGSAENCARFAAFVTSREMGRSIERSIYDAKEISVNFNKKGSGGKMVNATGQTLLGKVGSYVGGGGRLLYVFWNAGVQGTTNFARAAKRHPAKATAGAASMFMLGAVIPLLAQAMGGDDDDDKNAYYNLPEYVRRSNIIINAGNQWIAIPLPIEFRSFYGLGELATGVITGNERYSDSELAFQLGSQVSQVLPLDMLEGGGGINPFIPSASKPLVEAYMMNKSWSGMPIYKDTPWNKNNPEWTKAYKSANTYLVSGAKWLNENSGGDDYKKGFIDINPAKVEYLLSGIFGGAFTTGDKLVKMSETAFGGREFDWRNMLIASRVVKTGDERTANRKLSNEYFKYKEKYEETKRLLKNYSNEAAVNERYKHRLEHLQHSDEYLLYDVFDNYQPIFKSLYEAKDGADEATFKAIENEENALRRDMVDLMHAIEDDKKPDINAHVDTMLKREFEAGGRTQKPAGSRIAERLGGEDSYASQKQEYNKTYVRLRSYFDLAEDVMLQAEQRRAEARGDEERMKEVKKGRAAITKIRQELGSGGDDSEVMSRLRAARRELISDLGL